MSPAAIPRVKAAVRAIRADRARDVARRTLNLRTAEEIEDLLDRELVPSLQAADLTKE
jgi:phosphoenolpyruvate-protein kinase (PTS system EI component)